MKHVKNDPSSYKGREIKASAWNSLDERRDPNSRKKLLSVKMTRKVNVTIKSGTQR